MKHELEKEGVIPRWAAPEEIGNGILFLASEESSYITGFELRMHVGWTTR
ncbi:MAG TPA: SDR family oxidoreductase [Candidatus Lokiarchaeia archaeon]|nr:SDR family oxidoreductase [Candidatus Lokiarchaeia archaeon]